MITDNNSRFKISVLLIAGSILFSHALFRIFPGVFEVLNAQTVDRLFLLRNSFERFSPPYHHHIVHVDFNPTSIESLNQYHLSRKNYAEMINALASMGVSAQVFDYIFPGRIRDADDLRLIQETEMAGNVYFGAAFQLISKKGIRHPEGGKKIQKAIPEKMLWHVVVKGDDSEIIRGEDPLLTFDDLADASRGLGSLSVTFERDGVLRKIPVLIKCQSGFFPSLALRVAADYLNVAPSDIVLVPGKQILLKGATIPGLKEPVDIAIPIDRKGNMIVNYSGPWEFMDHYGFSDVLLAAEDPSQKEAWREELKTKIIIISDVATGSADIGPVPVDANYPLSGVHANVINSILNRTFLKELTGLEMLWIELVVMVLLLAVSLARSSILFCAGSGVLATCFLISAGTGFLFGKVILNIIRPLVFLSVSSVSILIYRYMLEEKEKFITLRQRDFIRETFGRYLSNEVVQELLDSPEKRKMSGEIREVTFLVSDLRGFTGMTSELPPDKIIDIINRYFEHMFVVIARYRGTVNELMGDGILTFFGAPLCADDDPERAVACAIEMQNRMQEVNAEILRMNLPVLTMGIGINTGEAVVGNLGSEQRAKYGALGNAINIAYRIESYTIGGQILISTSTYEKVRSIVQVKEIKEVRFKGISDPVCLYDLVGMSGKYNISLIDQETDVLKELDIPLKIQCFRLEGKTVSETPISGKIIGLGKTMARALMDNNIHSNENLKVIVRSVDSEDSAEAYSKVISINEKTDSPDYKTVLLQFTWLSQKAKSLLKLNRTRDG